MKLLKNILHNKERIIDIITRYGGSIPILVIILGYISKLFSWGNIWFFQWIQNNYFLLWFIWLTIFTLGLAFWIYQLHRRFVSGFKDNFKKDLRHNWDYEGDWRKPEDNVLLITNSDMGGISKIGALWENYTFMFTARIINNCIGVIIRAQDLNNYYMLQIHQDKIRPHRKITYPIIPDKEVAQNQPITNINFRTGWVIYDPPIPIDPVLHGWFNVKIVVRGQSISLYINDELIFQRESFLNISMGKIGFRNWGYEEACVKKVRVILQP